MSRDGRHEHPRNPFSSMVRAMEAAQKLGLSAPPPPAEFWRAVFMEHEDTKLQYKSSDDADWIPPNDVSPRPSGFVVTKPRPQIPNRPIGIENQRYLGSFKITEATKAEFRKRWRQIVLENGEGTYRWYDTFDEAGEKPVSSFGGWQKTCSIYETDLDAVRLGFGEEPLSDEKVAELEAVYMADVLKGDARKAEVLAVEYRRRGNKEAALRVVTDGMKADDHDDGIWKNYDEDKRSQRNIDRRLMSMRNRIVGANGALYNTLDCGESNSKRACEKCGKAGALGSDYSIGCVLLCYVCRKLPRSEWPKPKPVVPFFTFTPAVQPKDQES